MVARGPGAWSPARRDRHRQHRCASPSANADRRRLGPGGRGAFPDLIAITPRRAAARLPPRRGGVRPVGPRGAGEAGTVAVHQVGQRGLRRCAATASEVIATRSPSQTDGPGDSRFGSGSTAKSASACTTRTSEPPRSSAGSSAKSSRRSAHRPARRTANRAGAGRARRRARRRADAPRPRPPPRPAGPRVAQRADQQLTKPEHSRRGRRASRRTRRARPAPLHRRHRVEQQPVGASRGEPAQFGPG